MKRQVRAFVALCSLLFALCASCAYEKTTDILLSGLKKNDVLTDDQQDAAINNAKSYIEAEMRYYDLKLDGAKPEERPAIVAERNEKMADFFLMVDTEIAHGRMALSVRGDLAAFCVLHGVNASTLSQVGIVLGEGVDQVGATFHRRDREKQEKEAAEPAAK